MLQYSYEVDDPHRYGIVELDGSGRPIQIIEKPTVQIDLAVTGLYFYDGSVVERARTIKPSPRGEYEITDLNQLYLADGELHIERMSRGYAWLDTGTHDSLLEASEFVRTINADRARTSPVSEEIAFTNGWISVDTCRIWASIFKDSIRKVSLESCRLGSRCRLIYGN